MGNNTVFIQNILSPYRNRFFNALAEKDFEFSVFYMSLTEPDRNWDLTAFKMEYDYWIDNNGYYFKIGDFGGHINPRLIWRVCTNKRIKNIILAVSWTDPNIMMIALAKRLHLIDKRLFFWAEANYTAAWANKHNSKFKRWFKRTIFNSIDGALIIPGKMSEITFDMWGIKNKRFIKLPNTIDDFNLMFNPFGRTENELPVFIMPIRIIENIKGGLNFFKAIGDDNIRCAKFIIAGEGEDKDKYAQFIEEHKLSEHIIMKGFCNSSQISLLYNNANALVLPSFSDPSPLSLVEALFFHLPILCSNHCGNHFEAVKEKKNGLVFSPLDQKDIKTKYEEFIQMKDEWKTMGEESWKIYKEVFDTSLVIRNFINDYNIVVQETINA